MRIKRFSIKGLKLYPFSNLFLINGSDGIIHFLPKKTTYNFLQEIAYHYKKKNKNIDYKKKKEKKEEPPIYFYHQQR